MTVDAERHVVFDHVFNFRDLGGYETDDGRTVRWRTVFRADGVHRLTIDDIAPLGMRTVLDLRTPAELDERGRFTHDSVGYHHLPILETTWDRDALYVEV
ncbi:MAG TPA: tyrosine-protein phosphatase, partial [Acidimicrobiales bacterium]|nr:tyrosine-protein phosphatase [Acidimicrobiales bacterium]